MKNIFKKVLLLAGVVSVVSLDLSAQVVQVQKYIDGATTVAIDRVDVDVKTFATVKASLDAKYPTLNMSEVVFLKADGKVASFPSALAKIKITAVTKK